MSEIILSVIFTGDGAQTRAALALRGLRVARAARLAKLMRMPLLEELANLISGILVKRKSSSSGFLMAEIQASMRHQYGSCRSAIGATR